MPRIANGPCADERWMMTNNVIDKIITLIISYEQVPVKLADKT
jgi:hypothetical protein